MTIRPAGAKDVDAILLLERATPEAPHWSSTDYAAALASSGTIRRCILVAEVEGRLAGFAVGKVANLGEEIGAELESVAVAWIDRRKGIGQALCAAVVQWSRRLGAAEIELEVRAGSAGAIDFYKRLGFASMGRRRLYYQDPSEDALLMRMELARPDIQPK